MNLPNWLTCDTCGHALHDPDLRLIHVDRASPCCGATGVRSMWPSSARAPLELAFGLDTATEEGAHAAFVFVAAALEALLEETLWEFLGRLGTKAPVAFALMDRVRGREHLLKLYGKLLGKPAAEVLKAGGFERWYEAWGKLACARNAVAHGARYKLTIPEAETPALIDQVRQGVLPAMAALRNAGIDRVKAFMAKQP